MRVTKQILITHAERLFETLRDNGISSLEATLKADINKDTEDLTK